MTREEAIARIREHMIIHKMGEPRAIYISEALDMAIKALEQEPCEDAISRQKAIDAIDALYLDGDSSASYRASSEGDALIGRYQAITALDDLPPIVPQPKTGHCKDCKWWKDSDGVYRRGVRAESKCPINRKEVFEGNGYCYMYEPQESEE